MVRISDEALALAALETEIDMIRSQRDALLAKLEALHKARNQVLTRLHAATSQELYIQGKL